MIFGERIDKVFRNVNSFPINYLTPRAHVLAKNAQLNFLPQGGHFHVIKMDCLLFFYAMLALTNFNLPHFILSSMICLVNNSNFPVC